MSKMRGEAAEPTTIDEYLARARKLRAQLRLLDRRNTQNEADALLAVKIAAALVAKQAKNEAREWPDWRTQPADKAIEHDRSAP